MPNPFLFFKITRVTCRHEVVRPVKPWKLLKSNGRAWFTIGQLEISGSARTWRNPGKPGESSACTRKGQGGEALEAEDARTQFASASSESRNEAVRKVEKKKRGRAERYPKTPRAIYHAQRAQQEAKLGMLMWAAGAGSRYACATPRGANHRPRNGSCARVSSSRAPYNLGKMEEESHGFAPSLSLSPLLPPSLTLSLSLSLSSHVSSSFHFDIGQNTEVGGRGNEATARKSESNER